MPCVFIPNKNSNNYDAARAIGPLRYLTSGSLDIFDVASMCRSIQTALATSGPDDMLIISSLQVLNAIAAGILGYKHGVLNLLLFRNEKYIRRRIDLRAIAQVVT